MDVGTIQTELKLRRLYKGEPTGVYDKETKAAVEAYMQGYARPAKDFASWPDAKQIIAVHQALVHDRGIDTGPIDGDLGPKTRRAIEIYKARSTNGWKPRAAP